MLRVLAPLVLLVAAASAEKALSQADIDKFLEIHNQLRNDTNSGMPDLTWNNSLAKYAVDRVNKCVFKHDPAQKYGENLFMASPTMCTMRGAKTATESWGEEIKYVDAEWGCAYGETNNTCGHYSQQVWQSTTSMGCGIEDCDGKTMVFCEYYPPGNIMRWDMKLLKAVKQAPYS